jgi:hypothetical protein
MSRYLRFSRRHRSDKTDAVLLWHATHELQRESGDFWSIRHQSTPSPDGDPLALLRDAERRCEVRQ